VLVVVLLFAGLVSLAVGLLLSSTTWLVVSLGASLLAGVLLYRNRNLFPAARSPGARHDEADAPGGSEAPRSDVLTEVWVVDGRPRYHRADCRIISDLPAEAIPHSQASEDGFIPCSLCAPDAARTVSDNRTSH
jgi:hypothetical protein